MPRPSSKRLLLLAAALLLPILPAAAAGTVSGRVTDAGSKLALAALVGWLRSQGGLVIDCQQKTEHLASLGAQEIRRQEFEFIVQDLTRRDTLAWSTTPVSKLDLRRLTHVAP